MSINEVMKCLTMSIFFKLPVPIFHHEVVTLLKVITDVDLTLHQVIL